MTSDPWKELGYHIRKARLDLGWSLEELATEALGNGARKGYVGQVEKGLRNLSPETIDKFDQALDLPENVVKAAHMAPPPGKPDANNEKLDRDVERLLSRAAKDEEVPQMAETLMIALAYEFAGGKYLDLQTAYVGLRKALEAAEEIRKRGEMPPGNTGSQLNAVLAEVAMLNAEGELDQADALLEAEERRMLEAQKAERDRMDQQAQALLDRRLDQDRLRNDAAAAADRLIRDLIRRAPPGGVFRATSDLLNDWRERGERQGDPFDLRVALVLANRNFGRAKGPNKGTALNDLGTCRLDIGARRADTEYLHNAEQAFRAALKTVDKSRDPKSWAACHINLGNVLQELGKREADPGKLRAAIAAHRAALTLLNKSETPENWARSQNNLGAALQALGELDRDANLLSDAVEAQLAALSVRSEDETPEDWAGANNNLGVAFRWLGEIRMDASFLVQARDAYEACLTICTKENDPFHWAQTQWNLGDLALARFALDPDPTRLDTAEAHVLAARDVFAEGSDHQTERCDELLRRIAEERAGPDGA